jgi:Protein phosphatase 2C
VEFKIGTSAGHPGRPNEDFAGAVPGAVALLDGAGIPGTESICRHGTAWYTHRLGGVLLGLLSRGDGRDLTTILADAIEELAADHRETCDIANPSSPQATVAIARMVADRLDYLVLADCFVILGRVAGEPVVVADEREITARRICSAPLAGLDRGSSEYERVRDSCIEQLQARRNQPGGYWIAKDDPQAASHALTGTEPIDGLRAAALLSNGASRIVSPYALMSWAVLLDVLGAHGPDEIIRRVRRAETDSSDDARGSVPDDATIAYCTWMGSTVPLLAKPR